VELDAIFLVHLQVLLTSCVRRVSLTPGVGGDLEVETPAKICTCLLMRGSIDQQFPILTNFFLVTYFSGCFLTDCQAAGKYKQKGRDYVVEDGNIIHFKFNAGAGLQQAKKK